MKTSVLMCCLQNKFVVINVIVVIIFLVNTLFFHVYNSGTDSVDGGGGGGGGVSGNELKVHVREVRTPDVRGEEKSSDTAPNLKPRMILDFSKMPDSDKWILVWLTNFNKGWPPFNQSYLSFLDTIDGWTSIILGEAAGTDHGCKSCLEFATTSDDPHHHVNLFKTLTSTIKHGARQIYVMTSLHNVTSALRRMTSSKLKGVTYSGIVPFKPCTHFVQPLLSSGPSYSGCHDRNWVYSYTSGEFPDRSVIGLCEECGQNFLETETENFDDSHRKDNKIYCDSTTPNVAVSPERFVETMFENSLWIYDSFWVMFFYGMGPPALTSDGPDLKISFVVQRLLWEVFVSLSFVRSHDLNFKKYNSNFNETENESLWTKRSFYNHDLESKLCREKEMGIKLRILGNYLYRWQCGLNVTIDKCTLELSDGLLGGQMISEKQHRIIHEFVKMLNEVSYNYPDRSRGQGLSVGSYIGSKAKSLHFWPSSRNRQWNQSPFHHLCSRFHKSHNATHDSKTNLSSYPSTSSASASSSATSSTSSSSYSKINDDAFRPIDENISDQSGRMRSDVILVIVFQYNDPARHVQMANYYDYMYGRHFRHIVYCTSGSEMIDMFAKMYPQPLTFINLKASDPSLYSYLCVAEAMRMHHSSISGYLHLNSDTLLNPWTIQNLYPHLHKPWINAGIMRTGLSEREVVTPVTRVGQMWKDKVHGRHALNSSLQDLIFISKVIDRHMGLTNSSANHEIVSYLTKYNRIVKTFLTAFNQTKLSRFEIEFGITLLFYVPVRYRDEFIVLADEFSRYNVHSYIAIPTIVKNLDSNFLRLNGTILTTRHTSSVLKAYKSNDAYLHPWEMHLLGATKRSRFMCDRYLPQLEASLKES